MGKQTELDAGALKAFRRMVAAQAERPAHRPRQAHAENRFAYRTPEHDVQPNLASAPPCPAARGSVAKAAQSARRGRGRGGTRSEFERTTPCTRSLGGETTAARRQIWGLAATSGAERLTSASLKHLLLLRADKIEQNKNNSKRKRHTEPSSGEKRLFCTAYDNATSQANSSPGTAGAAGGSSPASAGAQAEANIPAHPSCQRREYVSCPRITESPRITEIVVTAEPKLPTRHS